MSTKCPSCAKNTIQADAVTGEIYCRNCGYVAADKVEEFHSKLDEIEKYAKAHKEELHLKSIDVDGFTHDMQQFETGFTKIKSHIYRTIGHFVESLSDISYHDRGQYDPSQDHWVRYDEVYQVGPKNKNWLKPHDEWEK